MRWPPLAAILLGSLAATAVGLGQTTDGIEFAELNQATACGWDATEQTDLAISREARFGQYALRAQPKPGAKPYRGLTLFRELDLTGAGPADRLVVSVKQNFGSGMRVQLWTARGPFNRSFPLQQGDWTQVDLDLDLNHWENPKQQPWGKITRLAFYENSFVAPEHFMILDGLSLTAAGKELAIVPPVHTVPAWTFPQQTAAAWFLGEAQTAWAISRESGELVGGWNAGTHERYLNRLEGRYHLEDRRSLRTGRGSEDRVLKATFSARRQRLELLCVNPTVADLSIRKQYWLSGNKLFQRVAFRTASEELQFITYNSEAAFTPVYRNGGYIMGGADGGGPLVPMPQILEWQKVTQYQNSAKSMLLHQPEKGFSFAHTRTRLDEHFVWPFFTGAIASYVEAVNMLHYTPDGWDMSLGTSRLSPRAETSYEQFVSIFAGDWQQFLRSEYPALPDVQRAVKKIPPVPAWVGDIKIQCGADLSRLRRMIEMTDEGTIMVLFNLSGSWADYTVEEGMEGGYGGWIEGPELREHIRQIKALSPRLKVGIYMWQLSTYAHTRIYRAHPEWFRHDNKDGEPLSTFPGMAPNFAQLLSIPACYRELLAQFDHVLSYLDTDFIYLDDPKAINLIDWRSGEYTRDDLCFRFFLDLKRLVARHGADKMLFFNNRGNPYGDVNFIEARDQLRANYWRRFAGIAAVSQEFVSSLRPQARINLLYFTPPLRREYMNRILALGWIPSLEYCDLVASRPFFQAAYEMGNCAPVPALYTPDWKRDKDTDIESYAVQREGDSGYIFSFISHGEGTAGVPVQLDLASLDLKRTGPLFVWEYVVADALEYEDGATESLARQVYRGTGWQLDRVTRRRLLYVGPYLQRLELPLTLEPLILHQLIVTTEPGAVYSEDGLAGNYLLARRPRVSLRQEPDWAQGKVEITVDADRDTTEVIAFLPWSMYGLQRLTLDGRTVEPEWVWEGEDAFPLARVGRGRHRLTLAFAAQDEQQRLPLAEFSVSPGTAGATVSLPGYERALLTVERDGCVLFNRAVRREAGTLLLPLSPVRPKDGTYTVTVQAVANAQGRWQPVTDATAALALPAAKPDLGLSPERVPREAGVREIIPVNRTIRGVTVLQSAVMTTPEVPNCIQPGLKLLSAQVAPDELTLEAGTSRAIIQGQDGLLGAAFAGLEIEGLRQVQVRLTNTYHDAFHLRGPGHHVPDRPNSRNFAGIVVDYHTPAGYTRRLCLATGVLHRECSSTYPDYPRAAVADVSRDLGAALIQVPEAVFGLDLQAHAPADWDGRVWLSVGCDWVCANRRLRLQILAANEAVTAALIDGIDPRAFRQAYEKPRQLRVPRAPGGTIVDGSLSEEGWQEAARTTDFFLLGGEGFPKASTSAALMYDDVNLYVAFTCQEPERRKPLIIGGPPWDDDEVEVWIDANGDGKTYRQIILNGANGKMEYWESGPGPIGATTGVHVLEGDSWTVEMAIPFAGLGVAPPKPGDSWRLSLCRGRPPGRNIPNHELIVWAPLRAGFKDLANFGTVTFR